MGYKLDDLFEDGMGQSIFSPALLDAVSKNKAHTVKLAKSKKPKSGNGGSGSGSLTLSFRLDDWIVSC